MKEIIRDLYNIEVLTFIKVSDNVYRVKANDKDYALKYIIQSNLQSIIEKLEIIKLNTFLYPIKNKYERYVSNYGKVNFILLPWIDEEKIMLKDLKLEFFLNSIAELHNKSFYTIKVNKSFFDETYDFVANKIDNVEEVIEGYMSKIERLDYKSPSQWLFLLNYPIYMSAISKANKSLEDFRDKCESKTSIRMSFTYNNFDYKHIILKAEKIIGIENIELAPPIYDVYYTFNSLNEINVDTKQYYEKYFKKFILDDYEKDWLLSLLYIPKLENLSLNELHNIENVISSLNYLKNSEEVAKIIKKEEEDAKE